MQIQHPIPVSLYIHMPWCVKKCPYCDFNSHSLRGELPEDSYAAALLEDFKQKLPWLQGRSIHSIFIGGGTPSLFTAEAYRSIFETIQCYVDISNIEITMEANPGTVEQTKFIGYREVGINRISLGIQSFNDQHLKTLGRIHNAEEAIKAVETAKKAGFDNFNLDLMFGLPNQSIESALLDLQTAIHLQPTHLSWYQLTLEPNTYFYKRPPILPEDDHIWEMQQQGQAYLKTNGFVQYEISAYSKNHFQCQHNLNYWEFGDYIGLGAGAHGKITDMTTQIVRRHWNVKQPKEYLATTRKSFIDNQIEIPKNELPLEFAMNAFRLHKPIPTKLLTERANLSLADIKNPIAKAIEKNLLKIENENFIVTELGKRFLNNLLELFI